MRGAKLQLLKEVQRSGRPSVWLSGKKEPAKVLTGEYEEGVSGREVPGEQAELGTQACARNRAVRYIHAVCHVR